MTRKSVKNATFLALTVMLNSGCEEPPCRPDLNPDKVQGQASSASLQIELQPDVLGLGRGPQLVTAKYAEGGVPEKPTHGNTGARLLMLSSEGRLLHEQEVPNIEYLSELHGAEILRSGRSDAIATWRQWMGKASFRINIPDIQDAQIVRIESTSPADRQASAAISSGASPRVTQWTMSEVRRTAMRESSASSFEQGSLDALLRTAVPRWLHQSGRPEKRWNLIILPDGYRAEELGRFREEAARFKESLMRSSPFREYANFINVLTLELPSAESGASCDDGTFSIRRTLFGSVFPVGCINASLGTRFNDRFVMQANAAAVNQAVDAVKRGQPWKTHVYVLVNSPKYGGAALFWASQTNRAPLSTFVHELGHSFGGLADEYMVEGDPCFFFNAFKPNIHWGIQRREFIKWKDWIDPRTGIPTPDTDDHNHEVGLFRGASNCSGFARPSRYCKMRISEMEFCSVCREQVIMRLYDEVKPVETPIQYANQGRSYRFSATLLKPDLHTVWYLDGKVAQNSEAYREYSTSLSPGRHVIGLAVYDRTPMVKRDRCHLFQSQAVAVQVR